MGDREVWLYGAQDHENARMPVTSEPGSSRGVQEPMDESAPVNEDDFDKRLIEYIYIMELTLVGERVVVCQGCRKLLREGGRVAAYDFRLCPYAPWLVGQAPCDEYPPDLDALATLDVREVVVSGGVGRCVDQAFQRDWLGLLGPDIEAVSLRGSPDAVSVSETRMSVSVCPLVSSVAGPPMPRMVSSEEGV